MGLGFRERSELVQFAMKCPGGLGALFLLQLQQRLHRGEPSRIEDLHKLDATVWAGTMTGLKEVRDLREVQVLTRILNEIQRERLPQAIDTLVQRVREILVAKRASASWEKAAPLSMIPSDVAPSAPIPDGAMGLCAVASLRGPGSVRVSATVSA